MHVLITGAAGYIGSRLTSRLLEVPFFADFRFTLVDTAFRDSPTDRRTRILEGTLSDAALRREALDGRADVILHLASILGGAAETNYALSRQVNVDATLSLLEEARDEKRPPRVVFPSSIAVFGQFDSQPIDDDTRPTPLMVYGAQKLMMEIVIQQFSDRGWIDGLALRLPGIVARRDADARQKSAFLNRIFYAFEAGENYTLPVRPEGTTWLISCAACIDALLHAAMLPPGSVPARRAFTLPAQRVSMTDLVGALARRFPQSTTTVGFEPDATLERQFASLPALTTAIADQAGFRHDGSLDALVHNSIEPAEPITRGAA